MDKENKVCINGGVLFIHEKCKKGCYWTTDRTENQHAEAEKPHPERQMLHVQSKTNKQKPKAKYTKNQDMRAETIWEKEGDQQMC